MDTVDQEVERIVREADLRLFGSVEEANWIAGAIKHPGALHRDLGVPKGKKIPLGMVQQAAKAKGTLGRRARLALTLRGFRKGKKAKEAWSPEARAAALAARRGRTKPVDREKVTKRKLKKVAGEVVVQPGRRPAMVPGRPQGRYY